MGLGKTLIILGLILVGAGLLVSFAPRIPFLGRLPGDILIKRDKLTLYIPITTCIVISLIVTLLLRIFGKK